MNTKREATCAPCGRFLTSDDPQYFYGGKVLCEDCYSYSAKNLALAKEGEGVGAPSSPEPAPIPTDEANNA